LTFIIAEIGVNWDGNYDLLKQMMEESKNSGCDAVKLQAFNENMVKDHPESVRLIKTAVTKSNVKKINKISKTVVIEWFCTPMFPEAIEFLNPFVKRFKVRAFDGKILLENKTSELLDRLLKTNKEIIVSSEISPKNSSYYNHPNLKWLYVVSKYPCEMSDLDFSNIKDFNGYSNHCPKTIAPLTAANLGAKIIEVHITSDKSKSFVDNNVSFDYNELRELVNSIRHSEKLEK